MPGKTIHFLDDDQWPNSCLGFDLSLDQEKTALCVIDMQNYCIAPTGALVYSLKLHDPELFDAYRGRVEKAIDQTQALPLGVPPSRPARDLYPPRQSATGRFGSGRTPQEP